MAQRPRAVVSSRRRILRNEDSRPIASGDPRGADAVPEPRVVGDFGETPGFVYRQHLESVIGQGAPPTSLLRRILLG